MRFPRILSIAIPVVASVFLFTGCDEDEDPVTPVQETARVMAIHASPDAPAVDILVDNVVAKEDLAYLQNTPYTTVNAGTRNIKVNVANTTTSVLNANLPVAANTSYSVFAIDSVASLEPLVTIDTLTTPAAENAHVRFFHLSPNAPAVDIAVVGGAVVFGNRAFRQYTSFTPLPAGTYPLEVRQAGTSTVVLPLGNITFTAGKIYTVIARGFAEATGTQALGAWIIENN